MGHRSAIVASLLLLTGAARAETSYHWVWDGGAEGPRFARQVLPATLAATAPAGLAKSRTIYLNRLGAALTPGQNNSQTNTSTIVPRAVHVPGWSPSAADWAATVACMRDVWSRFDVAITEEDPGTTPHIEAVFTRSPADVGMTEQIGGVSPFTSNCSVIEHSIVFAFTDNLPRRPRVICEIMSQEVGHSYGLDHELVAADPMTYLSYAGDRQFQDHDAACGETTARPCGVAGNTCRATQNSVQLLLARLGASDRDNEPPSVGITAPADRATLEPGFEIAATASDNIAVDHVAFYLDGELVATRTEPPYRLATDPALEPGGHTILVEAIDRDGNTAVEEREVTLGEPGAPFGLGCAAGRHPSAAIALVVACLVLRRRRRR